MNKLTSLNWFKFGAKSRGRNCSIKYSSPSLNSSGSDINNLYISYKPILLTLNWRYFFLVVFLHDHSCKPDNQRARKRKAYLILTLAKRSGNKELRLYRLFAWLNNAFLCCSILQLATLSQLLHPHITKVNYITNISVVCAINLIIISAALGSSCLLSNQPSKQAIDEEPRNQFLGLSCSIHFVVPINLPGCSLALSRF